MTYNHVIIDWHGSINLAWFKAWKYIPEGVWKAAQTEIQINLYFHFYNEKRQYQESTKKHCKKSI